MSDMGVDAAAIAGGTRLKTGADRAMEQRRMLEEKRIEAKMAVLVNEWGESLDDLQATWRPPAQHPKTHLRTVSEFGGIMARSEAEESTYRDTFKVAKNTDARIQQLAIAETLRDTSEFLSQRAIKAELRPHTDGLKVKVLRKAVLAAYARHAEGAPAAAALSVKERRKTFKVKLKKIDAVAVEKKLARLK